jgi:uncharacterized membrane protein YgdD (TMEM256/DUF423 family)
MWTIVAAILGATGVVLGAFGAHALRDRLEPAQLNAWNTGVEYHLLHVVALLALALYSGATKRSITLPAASFAAGITLFSGSLYVLALGGPRWFGPVTPLGGLCLIVGWAAILPLARPQAASS